MSDNARTIAVTIDGRPTSGKSGESILTVARRIGVDIPALCADERLEPFDSCGVCVVDVEGKGVVKSCSTPIEDGMVVTTDSEAADEVRKAALELLLSNHWGDCVAPCQIACPARTDCQGYVTLAANGKFDDGLKLLYEHLPFPASFGRICPAPCEDACRRTIAEEPLQIRHLKRFLGDRDVSYTPAVAVETGKRVAVVGGGPAGLSAAYFLRRRGHAVVVYEAMPKMGGMLRYGIPEYRLPHSVLDQEIDVFRRMGIELRNGVTLGKDISCAQLVSEADAVFLGIGAWGTHQMGIPGEDHPAVTQGTDFLRSVNDGHRPALPRRVVVIGGGNTAMDAARCARRLGADVTVLYRRTEEEMPALAHEVAEARDEQVVFRFLTQPVEFLTDGDALCGIRCVQMELGQPDESGRRRPVPIKGSEFVVDAGAALLAVGQAVDSDCLAGSGISVDRRGRLIANPRTGQCSKAMVFAGGDAVTGPSIAVEAVGAGHRAADAIDQALAGQISDPVGVYNHVKEDVTLSDIGHPATAPRIRTAVRGAEARVADFDEYEASLTEDEAVAAGQRCLECGCMSFNDCALREYASAADADQHAYEGQPPRVRRDERHPFIVRKVGKCVQCGRCIRVCRDVCGVAAIEFSGRGIETEVQAPFNRAWQDSDCVSCGACVDTCPTGALYDKTIFAKQVPLDLDRTGTVCALCGVGCEIDVLTLHGDYMRTAPSDGKSVLCARGRYGWHAIGAESRIVSPMIRRGSSLVESSWEDAFHEAAVLIRQAAGGVAVFGTGLLTNEEGWMLARLAEGMHAGSPIFDVVASPKVEIDAGSIASLDEIGQADLIVALSPAGSYEKVAMDAVLRQAIGRGVRLISVGAPVPGATKEFPAEAAGGMLRGLRGQDLHEADEKELRDAVAEIRAAKRVVFAVGSHTAAHDVLQSIADLVRGESRWMMLLVPATANGIGLRRLGFVENLSRAASVWISVGSDPASTAAGRRYLPDVEALIAVSPVRNATTERAQIVLPMRIPIETRGRIVGMRGERELIQAVRGPVGPETWEVIGRLATALGVEHLPDQYDALVGIVSDDKKRTADSAAVAGSTPASLAARIDRALDSLLGGAK